MGTENPAVTLPLANASPEALQRFLGQHPWDAAWSSLGEPMNYLWTWEFPVEAEALWPFLIDTSTFNQRLGLQPMHFEEREGQLYGSSGEGISRLEWREVPWTWEHARSLSNARDYSFGFARYVRSRFELEQLAPGRTRLNIHFGWIPRTTLGRHVILPYAMRSLERDFTRVLHEIAASIQQAQELAALRGPPLNADAEQRMSALRDELVKLGLEAELIDALASRLRQATDAELYRIRARPLARALRRPERDVVVAMLHATRKGLLTLTWDVMCPHCRGTRLELAHLGDVPKRSACDACRIDFETTGMNALEVTFHVHPSIRKVEKQMFCAAEPARKPHIKVQRLVAPGESVELHPGLGPGRFRLRLLGSWDYNLLTLQPGGAGQVEWPAEARGQHYEAAPAPALVLRNTKSEAQSFVVEEAAEDSDALRPADLFRYQAFRDLFSEEAVCSDVQLDVGTQAMLFTDMVGSTRYYEEAGDTVAFAHVKRHFVKAYEAVQSNEGAVVKTIGDAVMAVFSQPVNALRAAVKLMELFPANTDSPVRLRASLHLGPCLAVNLNSHIDYFGSTVNFCAKMQALAEAGQIAFSEPLRNDPMVQRYLEERRLPVEELEFGLKWHQQKSKVYRIDIQG